MKMNPSAVFKSVYAWMALSHVADAFGIYRDPISNVWQYYSALQCTYAPTVYYFYGNAYYTGLTNTFGGYTEVTDTTCCYKLDTRNKCCQAYDLNTNTYTCKCQAGVCGPQVKCPAAWKKWVSGTTTKCYNLEKVRATMDTAEANCKGTPGTNGQARVLEIHSQAESDFIKANVLPGQARNVWLGLRSPSNSILDYAFVTSGIKPTWKDWNLNKPENTATKHCVLMDVISTPAAWRWNNEPCTGANDFICELTET